MTPVEKLHRLREGLKAHFVERDEIIDGALAGLVSGEHVLLLGPVGTAKSMLARAVCDRIDDASYFNWLLTKFSTPEELFGPISLKGLESDQFKRITENKLPEAHIAFLDEVFKANSAILNSLLAVLNERIFHNGAAPQSVPLLSLFAASNELPEEGELMALFDRFLLRFNLDYVGDDQRFLELLQLPDEVPPTETLTLQDLERLQAQASQLPIPKALLADLVALRNALIDEGIEASDRRYRKSLDVLRAYALLDGRDAVTEADLKHLAHILWNDPEEYAPVVKAIEGIARRFSVETAELREKANQQHQYATRYWSSEEERMAASVESLAKLRTLLARADELVALTRNRDDTTVEEIRALRYEISEIIDALLHSVGSRRQ